MYHHQMEFPYSDKIRHLQLLVFLLLKAQKYLCPSQYDTHALHGFVN